ncbi:DUF4252 domain-containing protein [Marinirhabdus gelatinilytica]|uniref:Uncharacterized protein DUF4252 n=1 Tax=Marinirhabdus gelatinilytica TaxID=1703343 RepID=A0A370QFQ3_9FLAO|nr:DUF4252 domain-containing protein [Marinirhabdus gelatinilytica]RDK87191.1 uncharacterized protein DUF4252 [Marinirhabdus gelatinilytica]
MKKIAIIIALMVAPLLVNAQSPFDAFENADDVTSFVATKKMFKLLSKMDFDSNDPEVKEYLELVNNLENVRIFTTENPSVQKRLNDAVAKYVSGNTSLSELMRVNDDGKNVKFYSKEGKNDNFVTELLMHLTGNIDGKERTVVMSITGNIDLKKVSKLTKDLNVPGSEELKNIDKQKS